MQLARLTLLLLLAALSATAGLIVNGSFENGQFATCNNGSWCRVLAGGTEIDGWTVGGVGVDWHNQVEMKSPHSGALMVDLHLDGGLNQMGTLSQTFATTIGADYALTFYLAGPGKEAGFPDPRSVVVNVAGVEQTFSTPSSFSSAMLWGEHHLAFRAVAASTTLTFSSGDAGEGYWGPILDDVSVIARDPGTALPEPASALLAAGGLLAAFLYRRRTCR